MDACLILINLFFSADSQSELSLASQEELTEVINFLSGAPIKLRLLNDDADSSLADSHMTPIDSGLGSIYSVALSSITQPSVAPTHACEKADDKGSPDVKPSQSQLKTKESNSSSVDKTAVSFKDVEPPKKEMVTMETQTSPTTEVTPVLFVKSANADDQELSGSLLKGSGEQGTQPTPEDSIKHDSESKVESASKVDGDNDDKEKTSIPQTASSSSSSLKVKQDVTRVSDANSENTQDTEMAKLSTSNEEQANPNKTPSPVLVTVSSEEGNDDKTVSISESLR